MSPARNLVYGCLIAGMLAAAIGAARADEEAPAPLPMQAAWSVPGPWTGVVGDPDMGSACAIDMMGRCAQVDAAGTVRNEFRIPGANGAVLRLARLPEPGKKALLVFEQWGQKLETWGLDGERLWAYPGGMGIDDVWPGDLDGDGTDEVIVGYNGPGGVHVLDGEGDRLWRSRRIGNVWHVCVGDVLGTGKPQVVTTSAAGQVHVFDADGKRRRDLDPGCYASMVRIVPPSEEQPNPVIVVIGETMVGSSLRLIGLMGDGSRLWQIGLPADRDPHADSADCAPGRPWVAVGLRGGQVHVVDIGQRKIIGSVRGQGMAPQVGWLTPSSAEAPLLLVATGDALNAFRLSARPQAP